MPLAYGTLDPSRHFIARASGNSMNGGKNPVLDGDYLLLELITPSRAGSITSNVVAIERQDDSGDDMRKLTRLRNIIDPLDLALCESLCAKTFRRCLARPLTPAIGMSAMWCWPRKGAHPAGHAQQARPG